MPFSECLDELLQTLKNAAIWANFYVDTCEILIKSVTSGILFSISVTFELKLVQVTKPVILGFLFSISVIFVLSVALVNK